jgi:5-methylcytosine-specific restriction endonuclease McrA
MTLRSCTICGTPSHGPRCAAHATQRGYHTSHWQIIRTRRLELDGYRCQLQHPTCTGYATTVHLDPACGGNHLLATLNNTTSACRTCHGVEDAPRASGYAATSAQRGGSTTSTKGRGLALI